MTRKAEPHVLPDVLQPGLALVFCGTAAGKRFAESEVDARKQLFAQQLAAYVPLAAHIRRVLDERSGHKAPARRFRDELEDHMSEEYADQTVRAVISWARYAEYFAYDEESDLFTLDNPV